MLSIEWLLFVPVAIAAMIRGYTGFGFAAISILAIGQWYPVHIAVPVVLLLDAVTGLPLLLGSWRQCCVRTLNSLLLAGVAGMPAGLFLLFNLEEPTLRLLVALVILLMGLLNYLPSGVGQSVIKSRWICGVMSGWTTSAVSAGGDPGDYAHGALVAVTAKTAGNAHYLFYDQFLIVCVTYSAGHRGSGFGIFPFPGTAPGLYLGCPGRQGLFSTSTRPAGFNKSHFPL